MNAFSFQRANGAVVAAGTVAARPGAMFLAGGTTLVDLMKVDVLTPDAVVGLQTLGLSSIDVTDDAIAIGANVTNSQLAWHPVVRDRVPVLSEVILSGATTQIRNMATVAGNMSACRVSSSPVLVPSTIASGRIDQIAVDAAERAPGVHVNATYTTAANTNNPIGLFATVAAWDGDTLTVHDTAQYPHAVRDTLAAAFGIDPAGVRVLVPFVGMPGNWSDTA